MLNRFNIYVKEPEFDVLPNGNATDSYGPMGYLQVKQVKKDRATTNWDRPEQLVRFKNTSDIW